MQLLHWHLLKFWYLKVARLDFLGRNTSQVLFHYIFYLFLCFFVRGVFFKKSLKEKYVPAIIEAVWTNSIRAVWKYFEMKF